MQLANNFCSALKTQINSNTKLQNAIDEFIKLYMNDIEQSPPAHEEADMLLFQYGTYDWQDGRGTLFNVNLTRQVEVPNEEEYIQLGLTLFYDPKEVGALEAWSSWSVDDANLEVWQTKIQQTEGYQQTVGRIPKDVLIDWNWT